MKIEQKRWSEANGSEPELSSRLGESDADVILAEDLLEVEI